MAEDERFTLYFLLVTLYFLLVCDYLLFVTCYLLLVTFLVAARYFLFANCYLTIKRSSHLGAFCKKGVAKNFPKFTGRHLCQSLFFNKVAGVILKRDSGTGALL